MIGVIPWGMNDIEEVIKAAKNLRFQEPSGKHPLNRISSLPTSKSKLKASIKERIRVLYGAYIALASFIPDEDIEFLMMHTDHKRQRRIFARILKEMEKNRREIKEFQPLELST